MSDTTDTEEIAGEVTEAQKQKLLASLFSRPIWYAYLAKHLEDGRFVEGAFFDKENLDEKLEKKGFQIVWISEESATYYAVANYIKVLKQMEIEEKEAYAGNSSDPENFLKSLAMISKSIKGLNLSK
jgi:hypothetical protein